MKPPYNPNPKPNPDRCLHRFDQMKKCGLFQEEMSQALAVFLGGGSWHLNPRVEEDFLFETERGCSPTVLERNFSVLVRSLLFMMGIEEVCESNLDLNLNLYIL